MNLPYENSSSGERALTDIQKILRQFGCNKFGSMVDDGAQEILVQFEFRGRPVTVKASMRGYAAAWLRAHPWTTRMRATKTEHERKAMQVASTAVYSILRDWIKGQVTAIECGILTFEGAFLGQIMLPNGKTVLDVIQTDKLLPPPVQ
jgi:Xaa-Pro aminopeptidase